MILIDIDIFFHRQHTYIQDMYTDTHATKAYTPKLQLCFLPHFKSHTHLNIHVILILDDNTTSSSTLPSIPRIRQQQLQNGIEQLSRQTPTL